MLVTASLSLYKSHLQTQQQIRWREHWCRRLIDAIFSQGIVGCIYDMHGGNNGGCITRKDKSISLIPCSSLAGRHIHGNAQRQDCAPGSFTQTGGGEEEEGRRGQSVNLCIIRQCSHGSRKTGIIMMWLWQQNDQWCPCLVLQCKPSFNCLWRRSEVVNHIHDEGRSQTLAYVCGLVIYNVTQSCPPGQRVYVCEYSNE